jgi:MOSC domain-containing protein YiiM
MRNLNPTLDSVREELRTAIFQCIFYRTGFEIEQRNEEKEIAQQRACGFITFVVQSGLITPDEGNEWLDAVWERQPLAKVSMKYMKEQGEQHEGQVDQGNPG